MSLFRGVSDWLAGRPGPVQRIPFDRDPAPAADLEWPERVRLMRRCDEDCRVRDHRDALQRLGQVVTDLARVENDYRHLWEVHRSITVERDLWRARALAAEAEAA